MSSKPKKKKKNFKGSRYKFGDSLRIIWMDTVGDNCSWTDVEGYDFLEAISGSIIQMEGILIKETPKYVFLAQLFRPIDNLFSRVVTVPKTGIVKIIKN